MGLTNMAEGGQEGKDEAMDAELERVLREALRVEPLGQDALARIRASVENEWKLVSNQPPHPVTSRKTLWGSLAAVLALVVLATLWQTWPASNSANFGRIARADAGDISVSFQFVRQRRVEVGDTLRTGERLNVGGPVLISLTDGGTLRVAAGTVLEITGEAEARLKRGQVYVDLPSGASPKVPFRILTREGAIEHVGTAFEVLERDRLVRLRVREGRVRLHRGGEDVIADAGTELTAEPNSPVSRRSIETYGRDWLWVAALAPDYEIEGRPLLGFLEWASRELGRPLKFSDPHAREVAERTILHGSVRGKEPLDALSSVLATTSLSYEIRGNAIWIQSGHGI
jgi:ferric-dicitrate binding protein FerR (iron transport regulator)